MKFRDCTAMNSTEKIQEGYRNGPLKNGSRIKQLWTTIIYANHVLTCVLVDSNCQIPYNYSITAQKLLRKCDDYWFQRLILQLPASGKELSQCKRVHHNPSSKYASTCCAKRKSLHVLWDNWNHFLKFERIELKAWKQSTEKYHD